MAKRIIPAILLFILAAMMAAMAFSFATDNPYTKDPIDIATIGLDTIEKDTIYKVDDLVVWDAYAQEALDTDEAKLYAVVMFKDKSGSYVVASMMVPRSEEIYDAVHEYIFNDDIDFGTLRYSCYIKCERYLNSGAQNDNFETHMNDEERKQLRQEFLANEGAIAKKSNLDFSFECTTEEDYEEYAAEKRNMNWIIAIVIWSIVGVLLIVMIIVLIPKKKKTPAVQACTQQSCVMPQPVAPQEAAVPQAEPEQAPPTQSVQYCPQCGTPHAPTDKFCAACGNHLV